MGKGWVSGWGSGWEGLGYETGLWAQTVLGGNGLGEVLGPKHNINIQYQWDTSSGWAVGGAKMDPG